MQNSLHFGGSIGLQPDDQRFTNYGFSRGDDFQTKRRK